MFAVYSALVSNVIRAWTRLRAALPAESRFALVRHRALRNFNQAQRYPLSQPPQAPVAKTHALDRVGANGLDVECDKERRRSRAHDAQTAGREEGNLCAGAKASEHRAPLNLWMGARRRQGFLASPRAHSLVRFLGRMSSLLSARSLTLDEQLCDDVLSSTTKESFRRK